MKTLHTIEVQKISATIFLIIGFFFVLYLVLDYIFSGEEDEQNQHDEEIEGEVRLIYVG